MQRSKLFLFFAAASMAAAVLSSIAQAASVSLGASNDTWIRDGRSNDDSGPDPVLNARADSAFAFTTYVQFDLSSLTIDSITSATLHLWKLNAGGSRNDTITTGRNAIHGLDDDPNNTLQYWDESADFDPNDATDGLDFRNVGLEWTNINFGVDLSRVTNLDADDGANVTETIGAGDQSMVPVEVILTGPDLVSFLNGRVGNGGLATFIVAIEQTGRGYAFASKENADSNLHPQLDLTYTVPEPASCVLLLAAVCASVLGRRREV